MIFSMNGVLIMKVAVSACLVGKKCKYNGSSNYNSAVVNFLKDKEVFLICPEVMGNLSIPRIPAEIVQDRVINKQNQDVTGHYEKGCCAALKVITDHQISLVIVKEKSPSCGKNYIYDGTFTSTLIPGSGYFVRKLKNLPVTIYTEQEIEKGVSQ